ncbi:MAG: hypothetical protein P4L48_14555 [Mycobacterium sp.]|nr:hypothetical protein [Mycobacterium sp.]HKI41335.1 hypothetical protein [Mycobacterium sp.]
MPSCRGNYQPEAARTAAPLRGLPGCPRARHRRHGQRIVSAGWDHTLRLWDADTGEPIGRPVLGYQGGVFGVAFSPDGHRIVSAGQDETLRLWPAPGPAAWPGPLCEKLAQNIRYRQWREWVSPDISHITVRLGLPVPPRDSAE